MANIKLTPITYKALSILKDTKMYDGMYAKTFALKMWPDSPKHNKLSNTGNGATSGKGMWLCAGSYLNRLKKKGIVSNFPNINEWHITLEGRKALEEYDK